MAFQHPPAAPVAPPPSPLKARVLRQARTWLCLASLWVLAACQMDLYSKLKETDANEMLAVLLAAGVDAEKMTPDAGKTWTVRVQKDQAVRAFEVLRVNALPKERHSSLGELFRKDGLISSPTEERVRFIHGIEQELSATMSRIDGVLSARVHVVLPNNDPLASQLKPSSASVFVKHRREADLAALVPAIKSLVMHAVEGLSYDRVAVTLVPAQALEPPAPEKPSNVAWWAGGSALLLLLGAMASLWLLARQGKLPARWAGWLPFASNPASGTRTRAPKGEVPVAAQAQVARKGS